MSLLLFFLIPYQERLVLSAPTAVLNQADFIENLDQVCGQWHQVNTHWERSGWCRIPHGRSITLWKPDGVIVFRGVVYVKEIRTQNAILIFIGKSPNGLFSWCAAA